MSDPTTDPTPTPEPTPTPQEPAAAAPEPKADPEPKNATNPWEDPTAAKAEIERLRRENAASRTNAKQQAADDARKELAQTIGKALGLVDNEPVDPAKLTEQLTTSQAQAKQAALELAVFRSAPDAAAANALLDSRSFLATVAELDPNDSTALAAAVNKAVQNNPALGKRLPAPNPGQGSSGSGPAAPAQLTREDAERMYRNKEYAAIAKAQEEGRFNQIQGVTTT